MDYREDPKMWLMLRLCGYFCSLVMIVGGIWILVLAKSDIIALWVGASVLILGCIIGLISVLEYKKAKAKGKEKK